MPRPLTHAPGSGDSPAQPGTEELRAAMIDAAEAMREIAEIYRQQSSARDADAGGRSQ
jgi:hypothetical protein